MITDSFGSDLKTAIGNDLTLYYAEAETNDYPFCVYTRTVQEKSTKDGVYRIQSTATLDVVADNYETAKTKAAAVRTAIEGLSAAKYITRFLTSDTNCTEDIWIIELRYNIYQIS